MAIQFQRGDSEANNSHTGLEGSLTYDTSKESLRLHNGFTRGGHEIPSTFRTFDTDRGAKTYSTNPYWFYSFKTSSENYTGRNNYHTIVFDSASNPATGGGLGYDITTGVFTAPVDGVYWFAASLMRDSGENATALNFWFSRNGATSGMDRIANVYYTKSGTTEDLDYIQATTTCVVPLNAGDTIEVLQHGGIKVFGSSSEARTWFQGFLL